jgi:hypothetical protein
MSLYENELYTVEQIDDALDEDGKGRCAGYGIFNKLTNVREATGLVFGEVRWRADQFAKMVKELDEQEAAEGADANLEALAEDSGDVTIQ